MDLLNDETLIAKRNEWTQKLQDLFNGEYKGKNAFAILGFAGKSTADRYTEPEKWVEECLKDIQDNKANLILNDRLFVPICVECEMYGVHYIDKIFGANVFMQDGLWYNDYLKTPIGELQDPDLENNETFQTSIRVAKKFAKDGGKFPLFGLPTIASALNIAVNLYGQEILLEMLADPDNARKDLETINRTLVRVHKEFQKIVPEEQLRPVIAWKRTQPAGYGQICGCTTQLLSKELYRDMIADLDEAVLGAYKNGGMIHLCGSHTQHMETFRNMKTLKAVQLNDRAAEELELYFNGLRDDQIIYFNPCPNMTIEKAIEITKGKRLVICYPITEDYPI